LLQKLKQGVEVRIIIDSQGTKPYGPTRPMFTKLAEAGAQIVVNDVLPLDEDGLYPHDQKLDWTQDDVGRADHRKLYVIDGTEYHYGDLIDAGVQIWEYPGAVVHAKVVLADDTVVFGTVNLDAWSLYRNYEVAMMARSAAAVNLFESRLFDPDIARSRVGKPPGGVVAWAKEWFWDKLAYFL